MGDPRLLLRLTSKMLALVALFAVFTAGTAAAQQDVCWVDSGAGNDAVNDGRTQSAPNQTITGCLNEAYVGDDDIIRVEAGDYGLVGEGHVTVNKGVIFEAFATSTFTRVEVPNGMTISDDVTFRAVSDGSLTDGVFRLKDVDTGNTDNLVLSAGSLTIVGDHVRIPNNGRVTRDDHVGVTGTITYLGTANVFYVDNEASDTDVEAAGELPGNLNGGRLDVALNNNALNLTSPLTGVAVLDVDAGSSVDGTINVNADIDVVGAGNGGALIISAGEVDILAASTSLDGVTIQDNDNIIFDFNGNTLTIVEGDFQRFGGTLANTGGATLAFTGNTTDATLEPGPNFTIGTLSVNKNGQTLRVNEDVDVTATGALALDIESGTTVDFAGEQINVTSSGVVDNDGTITSLSRLVFLAAGADLRGDGQYGDIIVLVTGGGDITVGAGGEAGGEQVTYSGTLRLDLGGIQVQGNDDLSPAVGASVVVDLGDPGTDIGTPGGGTFNAAGNRYNLTYSGTLAGNRTAGLEWDTDDINNLSISISDFQLDAGARNTGTIAGNVTLAAAAVGDAYTVIFPNGAAGVQIDGSLSVGDNATLNGNVLVLNGGSHTVEGTIAAGVTTTLDGTVSLNGSTTAAHEALVGTIIVDNDATILNINRIVGNLTTNAGSTANVTLADERDITGNLTVNGSSFTMGSLIDVGGNANVDNAAFAFAGHNLEVAGNFSGTNDASYSSTGGALVLDTANKTFGTSGVSIPRVTVTAVTATLSSNVVIGNALTETGAGLLEMNGNNLTIGASGGATVAVASDGGTFIDDTGGTGALTVNNATLTMSGANTRISTGFTIADGHTLTLASSPAATLRQLLVDDGALTIAGTLALGIHDLQIQDGHNLLNNTGTVTAAGVQQGRILLTGGDIEPNGATLIIPNLVTTGSGSGIGVTSNGTLTITQHLELNASLSENDANDILVIGDGSDGTIIQMDAANAMVADPTFQGNPSIIYNAAMTTGNEMPDNGEVFNLTINASVTVDQDVFVNNWLTLAAALNQATAGDVVRLENGSRLVLQVDNANIPANVLAAEGNYELEYEGPNDTISANEFLAGGTVTLLVIDAAGNVITLDQARTAQSVRIEDGQLDLAGFNLTVTGDLTLVSGGTGTINNSGGVAQLIFAGTNNATLALRADLDLVALNIDLRINKTDATDTVTLTGGDLDLFDETAQFTSGAGRDLILNNGLLVTGDNVIELHQGINTTTGQPDQGFVRTLAAGAESHVVGNVRKRIASANLGNDNEAAFANVTFPTGTLNGDGPDYRPAIFFFTTLPQSTVNLTAEHVDSSPGGTNGFPIQTAVGEIKNYPQFFWEVNSDVTLSPSFQFDMALVAEGYRNFPEPNVEQLRIIRRSGPPSQLQNPWVLQGGNYDNSLDAEGDPRVTVRSATGGITSSSVFTIGQQNQPPSFVNQLADVTVAENTPITLDFSAVDNDINDSVASLEVVGALPEGATFDSATGEFTWTPNFDQAGTYTITVRATDESGETAEQSVNITVTDANRPPTFTAELTDQTIPDGQEFTFDYDAEDEDGDDLTFALDAGPAGASIDAQTGVFTWTPTFAQAGADYTVTVSVTDGTNTTTTTATLSVEADILYGDANEDGVVNSADATLVLRHAAGATTLTGKAFVQANVSGDQNPATVSAFDAALILQHVVGIIDTFPVEGTPKAGVPVASGDPAWGEIEVSREASTITLPITLKGNVENVIAIEFAATVDAEMVNFKQVAGMVPDDWQVSSSFDKESGKLKVAMAGTTPLKDAGTIANVTFEHLNQDAEPVFRGQGFVNENASVEFGEIKAVQLPTEFALGDNYPNPFNPSTTITYALPQKAVVNIEVYDAAGRLVQTLVNNEQEAGRYTVQWDGRNAAGSHVASGLYVYRINAGSFVKAKTMLLVK